MKVIDLKKLLENVSDNALVCFDSEARCFHAHLIELKTATIIDCKDIDGSDDILFCLFPNYENTTFSQGE